jgi:hypothetical protein
MTWLIWRIRSWFCKHEFVLDEIRACYKDSYGNVVREGIKVSALCKKCSFNRSFWKF